MKNKQRLVALALSGALVASSVPMVSASSFQDMPQDWSTTALENAVANGLLQGSNGKIMPDNNMTRAEMATIIARAFAADQLADISAFADVPAGAWYETSLAKAVQMGVLFGANGSLNPTDAITRQEAFCVLARAFALTPNNADAVDAFADSDEVADWARSATSAMIESGFVKGDDNNINPTNNITRKEFATLMDRMVSQYFTKAGTFQEVTQGSVMINTPDVILKDVTIDGDLIVGDGVGDGDVTLDHVSVEGNILVRGGGENTFQLLNSSSVKGDVIMDKHSGQESIRLLGDDTIKLNQINILDASQGVVLQDVVVKSVSVDITKPQDESTSTETTDKTPVVLKNTNVEKIEAASNEIALDIINSVIETLATTGDSTDVKVDKNTVVSSAVITGDNTTIQGEGKVSKVETSAANTVVNTIGTDITTTGTATGTVASGEDVKPDTSVTTKEDGVVQKPSTPSGGSTTTRPSPKTFDSTILEIVESFDDCVIPFLDGKFNLSADDFVYIESFITSYIEYAAETNEIDITGLTVKVNVTDSNGLSATLTQPGYATKVIALNHVLPRESFTVTFDLQGGIWKDPKKTTQVVKQGEYAIILTAEDISYIPPTEEGKQQLFDNWVDAEGVVVTELTVTETTTLYATYKEDPRTIAQQRIDKGRTAINNNDPTPITVVDGEITKVGSFTVDNTSTTNDLDTLLKNEVSRLLTIANAWGVYSEVNSHPVAPFTAASIRLVYVDAVTGEDSTVTDTIASLALAPSEFYTITFEIDEKKGSISSDREFVVQKDEDTPKPTVMYATSSNNWTFVGWTTDGGTTVIPTDELPVVTATTTYTAVFKENFTVTFNDNIADAQITVPEAQTIKDGETATEPTEPTKENAIFKGWYTDEACAEANKFDFSTPITASMTLYAKWTPTSTGKIVTTVDTSEYGSLVLTAAQADEANITTSSKTKTIFDAFGFSMYSNTQHLTLMDDAGVLVDDEGNALSTSNVTWTPVGAEGNDGSITFTLTADFSDYQLPDGYTWKDATEPTVTLTVTVEAPITITGLRFPDELKDATLTRVVETIDGETANTLAPKVFGEMGVTMPTTLLAEVGDNEPVEVAVTWTAIATSDGYQLVATANKTPSGYVFATNKNKLELGISISAVKT